MACLSSRILSLSLTLAVPGIALSIGGCDRQSEPPAQPAADAAQKQAAPGAFDVSHKGSEIPDFTLTDPAGKKLRLQDLKGTPVLLNLWATWCAPCVTEMPLLDTLAGDMKGKLRVITASQDIQGAEKVAPFFAQRKFAHLEPWLDPENDLVFHFGGNNLPLTVLYDAKGREVWRVAGDLNWSAPDIRARVNEGLN